MEWRKFTIKVTCYIAILFLIFSSNISVLAAPTPPPENNADVEIGNITNNVFRSVDKPFDVGAGAPVNIVHQFTDKSANKTHTINYKDNFTAYKTDGSSLIRTCWLLEKSDYFTVQGSYYICFAISGIPGMGTGNWVVGIFRKVGDKVEQLAKLPEDSLQNKYFNYINGLTKNDFSVQDGNGERKTIEEYFPINVFKLKVEDVDDGKSAPIINLPGSDEKNRPALKFKLTKVIGWTGGFSVEQNNFYFTLTETPKDINISLFSRLALKIRQDGTGEVVVQSDQGSANDMTLRDGKVQVEIDSSWLSKIINRVYNAKSDDTTSVCGKTPTVYGKTAEPPYTAELIKNTDYRQCINAEPDGWLAKWGVTFAKGSNISNPSATEDACGCEGSSILIFDAIKKAICSVLCLFYDLGVSFSKSAANALNMAIGTITNKPKI